MLKLVLPVCHYSLLHDLKRMDVHLDKLPEVIARYLIARELVVWTRQPVVVDLVAGCASTGEVGSFPF